MSGQQKTLERAEDSFVERMARQLGIAANAKNIYADPVERDGVTVIPVAKAVYGFGGGSGNKEKENENAFGGGGGAVMTPVGYIEIKDGETRFRAARDPIVYVSMIAALAPLAMFAVWRLTRALRKTDEEQNNVRTR